MAQDINHYLALGIGVGAMFDDGSGKTTIACNAENVSNGPLSCGFAPCDNGSIPFVSKDKERLPQCPSGWTETGRGSNPSDYPKLLNIDTDWVCCTGTPPGGQQQQPSFQPGDSCGSNSTVGTDMYCHCNAGYDWAGSTGTDCVPLKSGTGPTTPSKPKTPVAITPVAPPRDDVFISNSEAIAVAVLAGAVLGVVGVIIGKKSGDTSKAVKYGSAGAVSGAILGYGGSLAVKQFTAKSRLIKP